MVSLGTNQLFILIILAQASSTQKECYRLNPRGGYDPFCCNNHVRMNGACVECKPGTSSQNEKPCKPCNRGRYGINCEHYCNCKICDSVDGCKLKDELFTTGLQLSTLSSTVESIDNVSYTSPNQRQSTVYLHESTSSKATMKPPTSTLQHVLHTNPMLEQSSVTLIEHINMKGLSTREVLVYSLGSAAFGIVCTFMCVAFIWFHRVKTRQLIENSTINSENQVNDDTKSCYSLYESIDEDAMYDDNILEDDSEYSENKYCKTESEDSTLNSEKSGYLLPFTSIIPNHGKEEHPYSRDVRYFRGSTVSSLSNDIENDLKHINSYEQLQTEELSEQSQSEYTQLQGVQYLELLDIRKKETQSDDFITEFLKSCCDPPVSNIMHISRNFRKCYSNNDISDEEMFDTYITSKNKTEIRRCNSE